MKRSEISFAKIDERDEMLVKFNGVPAVPLYFQAGLSAIYCIQKYLHHLDLSPDYILDLPCGYGRVLRFLKASFPWSSIYHSDLNVDSVSFCQEAFKTHGLHSLRNFDELDFKLDFQFDLIWVGSLITHLSEERTSEFIRFCMRNLSDRGVLLLSSHGSDVYKRIAEQEHQGIHSFLKEDRVRRNVLSDYDSHGYGYVNYLDSNEYGLSLISRTWFERQQEPLRYKLVGFNRLAWNSHHDIVAIQHEQ